jgi:carbohydrate binding protein with CBM6 domain/pectate lyase-like protein
MRNPYLWVAVAFATITAHCGNPKRYLVSLGKTFFSLMVCLLALWPNAALGNLICYDSFNDTLGNLAGQSGGAGFNGAWTAQNNSGDGTFTVTTGPSMAGVGMVAGGILNLENVKSGSYAVYNNVNLTGATTFTARVASAASGGTISIYTGSPTGTLLGTATVPATGGWQNWVTVTCPVSGATGSQTVYLVFSGSGTGGVLNLEWFTFGNGYIWASTFASVSGGIGTQPCSEVENIQYTGNSVNAEATISRALATPLTGTYYGCYTFSATLTGTNGPMAGMATGAATNTDSTAAFAWSGNASGSLKTNAKANGVVGTGTANISTKTLYLYIFSTNTSTNTTTGWVLTAAQLSNFLTNNTLTVANLNAATIGTASTDVFSRQTATASGSAASQSNLILFGSNSGQTAYTFNYGGICISNASTLEAVTAQVATPPTVYVPTQNSNESVVATTTPQAYGAVADGVTDNTAAFQAAINAAYNQGHRAGGVVYVPAGTYAFHGNLILPQGVTLHGDWKDWTTGTGGCVGTTFAIYTTGAATGTPFLTMLGSCGVKGINFWYPNQSASSITPYPYTIQLANDDMIQNVVLINSYQGIDTISDPARSTVSTVIGSPLLMGFNFTDASDVPLAEDLRFAPTAWEVSGLTGAPSAGGPQEAWMLANGTGIQLTDGVGSGPLCTFASVSGYNIGITTPATLGCSFYGGTVTNCNTAISATGSNQIGQQFANMTISGGIAFTGLAQFYNCQLTGTSGTAVTMNATSWNNWTQFQNCTINGTIVQNGGDMNAVNCSLTAPTQCTIAAASTRTGFTGCTFSPSQHIVNNGAAANLLIDPRQAGPQAPPSLGSWSTVVAQYLACKPAKTTLFVATTGYGATGNGTTDDTAAIQSALNAAGANGGGIVYLPGGHYKTSTTLTVPSGVELRGVYELRHDCGPWPDGFGKNSMIQPTAGSGTTTGPVAVALKANSGIRGVDISYETQSGSCTPFPAAIQGQGANVYIIAVVAPNAYNYVDLDTYSCPNHFLYMVDGYALNQGFHVGNGSSGTITNSQFNPDYWNFNSDSNSVLSTGTEENEVDTFCFANLNMFLLGSCTETLMKDFYINGHDLIHCVAESGAGPNVMGINVQDDETEEGLRLESTAPSTINMINASTCPCPAGDDTNTSVAVVTTPAFGGTAWFYNMSLYSTTSPTWNFMIGGGDVGVELLHSFQYAPQGSQVTGGVFHLINNADYITRINGKGEFPVDNIAFTSPGLPNDVSELIGNYGSNGYSYSNSNPGNWIDIWNNYAENATSVLTTPSASVDEPTPTEASTFNSEGGGSGSITTQACSEGGLNIDNITSGSYTVYNNVDLTGAINFVARVASNLPVGTGAGTISVYLDSPTGTLIGTCSVNGTGGWQNWATVVCPLSRATGYHNVYLVYTGSLNLEWFVFLDNSSMTFTQWEELPGYFSTAQMSNSAISGPNATPENDGIPNLLKYLFDINPANPMSAADLAALPQVGRDTTTTPGTQYLTLTYRENASINGLTVNVQMSTDLQNWQTVVPDLSGIVGTDPTTQDPINEVEVKISSPQEFIRLNITSP